MIDMILKQIAALCMAANKVFSQMYYNDLTVIVSFADIYIENDHEEKDLSSFPNYNISHWFWV